MLANGLELRSPMVFMGSCPAEAGYATRTLGHAGGQDKHPRRPGPPVQPKVLVPFQGFSELLGGPQNGRANKVCPMIYGLRPASVTTFVFVKKPSIAAERSRLACQRLNSSWSITPAACASWAI